jgi:hypothetical protein
MATRPFFATSGVAAFRLSSFLLGRAYQTRSGEPGRSLMAAYRYEQLRIASGSSVPRRDRASNARQVFAELHDDQLRRRVKSLSEVCSWLC